MPSVDDQRPVHGTGGLIKRLNRSRILECLQREGPLSRVELAQLTGISLPAVTHLVAELEAENLVVCVGKGESSGGRPPVLYAYNFQVAYVVGVDLGATNIVAGVTDLDGNVLAVDTMPTFDRDDETVPFVERLIRLIDQVVARAGVDPAKVMGLGIGVPGVPDVEKGTLRLAPGLMPGRSLAESGEIAVVAPLEERYGWPVHLDNDVNAILRGERWKGALRGVQHGLCVTIGTGIGAALLVNGEVYAGARGAAGEIGYSLIGALGPIARASGYGPLEAFAAGPGIARRYVEQWKEAMSPAAAATDSLNVDDITARSVALAARRGDKLAVRIWHETADAVGVALANACLLLDPEVVVLGGGVARAPEELFLERVRHVVETMVPYPPQVVTSELGDKAGILGAVAIALDARRNSISYVTSEVGV